MFRDDQWVLSSAEYVYVQIYRGIPPTGFSRLHLTILCWQICIFLHQLLCDGLSAAADQPQQGLSFLIIFFVCSSILFPTGVDEICSCYCLLNWNKTADKIILPIPEISKILKMNLQQAAHVMINVMSWADENTFLKLCLFKLWTNQQLKTYVWLMRNKMGIINRLQHHWRYYS